jgi:sec-independent protein translocase protein TatC
MAGDQDKQEDLAEGTLMSHLLELRDRLLKGLLALMLAFVPCAIFANELYSTVAQPLLDKLPKGTTLIATNVVAPFMTPFKLAFYVAIFLAMPVLLYQIWAFVAACTSARNASRFRCWCRRWCCSTRACSSPSSWCSR